MRRDQAIRELPYWPGHCYTHLNGRGCRDQRRADPGRKPKMDVKRFARLNTGEAEKEGTSVQEVVKHTD